MSIVLVKCLLVLLLRGLAGATETTDHGTSMRSVDASEHDLPGGETGHGHHLPRNVNVANPERFNEILTILLVIVFIMIVILAKTLWHSKYFEMIANNIPESCMLIVLGVFVGGLITCIYELIGKDPPQFSSFLFFIILLPPIVLEAGYFMNKGLFFKNIGTILLYAFTGTLFNAFTVGGIVYGVSTANSAFGQGWSVAVALLFGVITSAVDPVAVLAVFEEIHVDKVLHILVFGESLLNDAVTVVLFNLLDVFANKAALGDPVTGADVGLGLVQFLVVIIASILIGIVMGLLGALLTKYTEQVHVLEPIIVFVVGYLSYLIADGLAFSGIVCLIVCAMAMRHYMEPNLSRKSITTTKYSMKVLSNVSESVIFLFLGLSLYNRSLYMNINFALIAVTIVFCSIMRPIGVLMLTAIANLLRRTKIGWKEQLIISYSGLRGAVAFSLALLRVTNIEEARANLEDSLFESEHALRNQQTAAILALTLFTVFVQGSTIKLLSYWVGIKKASVNKSSLNETIHDATMLHIASGVEDIIGHFGDNRLREKLINFDVKYIRPLVERYPRSRDHHILRNFKRLQYKESHELVDKDMVFMREDTNTVRVVSGSAQRCTLDVPGAGGQLISRAPSLTILPMSRNPSVSDIPTLQEIIQYSHPNPHSENFKHKLDVSDREFASDRHSAPVRHRRTKIQRQLKRIHKKKQKRPLSTISAAFSACSHSPDNDPPNVDNNAIPIVVVTNTEEDKSNTANITPAVEPAVMETFV